MSVLTLLNCVYNLEENLTNNFIKKEFKKIEFEIIDKLKNSKYERNETIILMKNLIIKIKSLCNEKEKFYIENSLNHALKII